MAARHGSTQRSPGQRGARGEAVHILETDLKQRVRVQVCLLFFLQIKVFRFTGTDSSSLHLGSLQWSYTHFATAQDLGPSPNLLNEPKGS